LELIFRGVGKVDAFDLCSKGGMQLPDPQPLEFRVLHETRHRLPYVEKIMDELNCVPDRRVVKGCKVEIKAMGGSSRDLNSKKMRTYPV